VFLLYLHRCAQLVIMWIFHRGQCKQIFISEPTSISNCFEELSIAQLTASVTFSAGVSSSQDLPPNYKLGLYLVGMYIVSWSEMTPLNCGYLTCSITYFHRGQLLAGFRHLGNTFGVKPIKNGKKPAPNLSKFQFVVPVIIKDFYMFTASNDQKVMNVQIIR